MIRSKELNDSENRDKKILLYYLGTSLSYILMVGGLIVFILAVLGVDFNWIGGLLSAYISIALAIDITFLYRPLKQFELRKFFVAGSIIFLLISIILTLNQVL